MIDQQRLGSFIAESMEHLEKEFGPETELGDFLLVTELRTKSGDGTESVYLFHSSDPRSHVQIGLIRQALRAAEGGVV